MNADDLEDIKSGFLPKNWPSNQTRILCDTPVTFFHNWFFESKKNRMLLDVVVFLRPNTPSNFESREVMLDVRHLKGAVNISFEEILLLEYKGMCFKKCNIYRTLMLPSSLGEIGN